MGWRQIQFPLLVIDVTTGAFTGLFVYKPAPGPGNLVDSITAAAGTDPYGNHFRADITTYGPGAVAQLTNGTALFHDAAMTVADALVGAGAGTDELVLQSGQAAGHNLSSFTVGSTTGLTGLDGRDSEIYGTERLLTGIPSGNIPAGGTVYQLLNINLIPAVATYIFKIMFVYSNAVAAGTANFQLGGTATLGTRQTLFTRNNDITAGSVAPGSPATFTTLFSGGALNTGRQFMEITGIVDLTTSGTLTLTVTRNIAADNVLVGNGWYEIYPL